MKELTDGNVADFLRSIEMIGDAVYHARAYFERNSEAQAAMHASDKVMYSPIVAILNQAETKLDAMALILKEE